MWTRKWCPCSSVSKQSGWFKSLEMVLQYLWIGTQQWSGGGPSWYWPPYHQVCNLFLKVLVVGLIDVHPTVNVLLENAAHRAVLLICSWDGFTNLELPICLLLFSRNVLTFSMKINGYFFCIFWFSNKLDEIKTSSKFGENNSGLVKTRFVKQSDEQII